MLDWSHIGIPMMTSIFSNSAGPGGGVVMFTFSSVISANAAVSYRLSDSLCAPHASFPKMVKQQLEVLNVDQTFFSSRIISCRQYGALKVYVCTNRVRCDNWLLKGRSARNTRRNGVCVGFCVSIDTYRCLLCILHSLTGRFP